MINYIIIMNITTMATYVTLPLLKEMAPLSLQFNDGEINLFTSSFLFKQSKLLQSFDIEEDNNIPIICSRSYIIDENNACLFDDKTDLLFIFTLQPNKFLEVCKFLDIICYENEDTLFSNNFIIYVMTNLKEEINIIRYFMQPEIRSIMNYINNEDITVQIKSCTPTFYALYLTEYKEEVIKHNRIDIYELSLNKSEYYRYIHKYNNHITYIVKETQEYKDYIIDINNKLLCESNNSNLYNIKDNQINLYTIKELIEQGANVNFQNNNGETALHIASYHNYYAEVIQYLAENSNNINLQDNDGYTALHRAARYGLIKNVQYLTKHNTNINLQTKHGHTALHYAVLYNNSIELIKLLIENNINIAVNVTMSINLQNIDGKTALHYAVIRHNNIIIIKYLIENGINVNSQDNDGNTALYYAGMKESINSFEIIQYLVEHGTNINLQNNDGNSALHIATYVYINNIEVIQYFVEHGANVNLKNKKGKAALDVALFFKYKKTITYLRSVTQK